jgi:hypothetical protein
MMKTRVKTAIIAAFFASMFLMAPVSTKAQQAQEEGGGTFILGSILLSILHFPIKLATCAGTQATAAVAYAGTYGVPGHYDGGTNGRDIGETARKSCTGDWLISPQQVKKDYGS